MKGPRSWTVYRWVMFAAAASLAAYIPYKYATKLHAIEGLYAFLFPLSSVLAIAGIVLAIRPGLVFRVPLLPRAVVGAVAVGWMATGMLCAKSLTLGVIENPGPGTFAVFHMLVQHVVLSVQVAALALAPRALYQQLGVEPPAGADASEAAEAASGA